MQQEDRRNKNKHLREHGYAKVNENNEHSNSNDIDKYLDWQPILERFKENMKKVLELGKGLKAIKKTVKKGNNLRKKLQIQELFHRTIDGNDDADDLNVSISRYDRFQISINSVDDIGRIFRQRFSEIKSISFDDDIIKFFEARYNEAKKRIFHDDDDGAEKFFIGGYDPSECQLQMNILISLKNDWNDGILEDFATLCQARHRDLDPSLLYFSDTDEENDFHARRGSCGQHDVFDNVDDFLDSPVNDEGLVLGTKTERRKRSYGGKIKSMEDREGTIPYVFFRAIDSAEITQFGLFRDSHKLRLEELQNSNRKAYLINVNIGDYLFIHPFLWHFGIPYKQAHIRLHFALKMKRFPYQMTEKNEILTNAEAEERGPKLKTTFETIKGLCVKQGLQQKKVQMNKKMAAMRSIKNSHRLA
jgi:hypothetical protein